MKRVFNLLVVDESGSMSIIRRQALVGINETLATIQKMQKAHKNLEQRVTLITFDSTHTNVFLWCHSSLRCHRNGYRQDQCLDHRG